MKKTEMPEWAKAHFPKTKEQLQKWEPIKNNYALHSGVLVVATTRIEGCWCAYCAPVPGMRHEEEMDEVLAHGNKIDETVARVLFPWFDGIPYAH